MCHIMGKFPAGVWWPKRIFSSRAASRGSTKGPAPEHHRKIVGIPPSSSLRLKWSYTACKGEIMLLFADCYCTKHGITLVPLCLHSWRNQTSTFRQHKGRAPQPSCDHLIPSRDKGGQLCWGWGLALWGAAGGGGEVLHNDNDQADVTS